MRDHLRSALVLVLGGVVGFSLPIAALGGQDMDREDPVQVLLGETEPEPESLETPVERVLRAMTVLARTEHTTPERLTRDPERIARFIVEQAVEKQLDPLLLVVIAWTESRFRPNALGDYKDGVPRSCGMTQIRTDFEGRPSCEELLDPQVALAWTADHLVSTSADGKIRLNRYNGGDYEVRIWRKVDWLRREIGHTSL